jgi:hypothetical protein
MSPPKRIGNGCAHWFCSVSQLRRALLLPRTLRALLLPALVQRLLPQQALLLVRGPLRLHWLPR